MIKIFRNLRKQLLSEGKTSKYLKYAIGEIALVVIGILIALSINNWNQKRIERNEEILILNVLKEDYKSAIEEFQFLNSLRSEIISATKMIYEIEPESIEKYPTVYLDSLFGKTLAAPTFNNKSGSLDVLLTSGKINLISNKELKEKLIEWPGDVEDMIEDEIIHSNLYSGKFSDFMDQYISWNDLTKAKIFAGVRFNRNSLESLPKNRIVSSDYKAILSDKAFLNTLNRRSVYCQLSNDETIELIEKANKIIDLIESDFKK